MGEEHLRERHGACVASANLLKSFSPRPSSGAAGDHPCVFAMCGTSANTPVATPRPAAAASATARGATSKPVTPEPPARAAGAEDVALGAAACGPNTPAERTATPSPADADEVDAWRNGIIAVEVNLVGRCDVSGPRQRQLRWPVGPHAQAKLGWSDFGNMVFAMYSLSQDTIQQTESRVTWAVLRSAQPRPQTSAPGERWRPMHNTKQLWAAVAAAQEQASHGSLHVTVELRRPSEIDLPPSGAQLKLRRKLEERRAAATESTAPLASATQHRDWTSMDPTRRHWQTWKSSVTSLLSQARFAEGGVTHVIPPRSRKNSEAYMLMTMTRSMYFNTFTACGRRFAFVAAGERSDNEATLRQLLQEAGGLSLHAVGCTTDPLSSMMIAQDMVRRQHTTEPPHRSANSIRA